MLDITRAYSYVLVGCSLARSPIPENVMSSVSSSCHVAPKPPIVGLVIRPIHRPIEAEPGDWLTVWPGHPTHALAVVNASRTRVLHRQWYPDDAVWGVALDLYLDGAVRFRADAEKALLSGGTAAEP
jgi:hypothetical protein